MQKLSLFGILLVSSMVLAAGCQKTQTTNTTNTASVTNVSSGSNDTEGSFSTNTSGGTSQTTLETVTISSAGVTPKTLTIKSGTTVVFKNQDTALHEMNSNPHPDHTDYPGFGGVVNAGGVYQFTFTRVGTWGYHDHENPFDTKFQGTIVVQ